MRLNYQNIYRLLASKRWSETDFAKQLNLHYSFIYRIMRRQRKIGKKFITNFMKLCEKENLNYRDYIFLDDGKPEN